MSQRTRYEPGSYNTEGMISMVAKMSTACCEKTARWVAQCSGRMLQLEQICDVVGRKTSVESYQNQFGLDTITK